MGAGHPTLGPLEELPVLLTPEPSLQLTFPQTLACVGLPWVWQSLYSGVAHIEAPEGGVILLLPRVLCPVPVSEQLP